MEHDVTDLKGKKILFIEDDPLLHSLLADKMSQMHEKGLEIHAALNAEEGLTKAREVKPDLILLDIVLPGMTGFGFLEQLRKEEPIATTPVVVLSNLSDDSDRERAKALGVIGYIIKADFSLSEILSAVDDVLHGKDMAMHSKPTDVTKTSQGYMIYL